MPRVDEELAAKMDGQWADGSPRPCSYGFGVQVARRDVARYGAHNVSLQDTGTEYAQGYNDALLDARDALTERAQKARCKLPRAHPCPGDLGSVPA